MPAQERAQRFQAGNPWDGLAVDPRQGALNRIGIETFSEFPLVWIGESFAGYHLRAIRYQNYDAPGRRPQRNVTFIYGTCTPEPGADGCPVPAQVVVHPICNLRPEWVAEAVKAGPLETVRGQARAQRFRDGHIIVFTGSIAVDVTITADSSLTDEAVRNLRGPGGIHQLLPQGPLSAPDTSRC